MPFRSSIPYPVPQLILPRKLQPPSSLSNTRYRQLKKSTTNSSRRSFRNHYRPSETRSISDLEQISRSSSARLLKAHPSNLSVAYAHEAHLTPKPRRKGSIRRKTRLPPPPPPPPQRRPSFRQRRKRPVHLPERGLVRISTLDEMPMVSHRAPSINHDRISTKGSISNSSQHRIKPKEKSRGLPNESRTNTFDSNLDGHSSSSSSSSSSDHRSLSLQQRLNGSLRNDPLIIAAMEDYRQLRRSNSQTTSLA